MCCRFFAPALALFLSLVAPQVPAEELPKFSDKEVNDFVGHYAKLVEDYTKAYKAAKEGNASAFEQFIATYTQKMIDATK